MDESHKTSANEFKVEQVPTSSVKPSPENDDIYNGVNDDRSDTLDLVKSVAEHGIKEPLVLTQDGYLLSGHRRLHAALKNHLETVPVCREDEIDELR